jgi:hypothetical protein
MRLENNPNLCFDMQFVLNQCPFHLMHYAVDMLLNENKLNMLFPEECSFLPLRTQGDTEFLNPIIQFNTRQQAAVKYGYLEHHILHLVHHTPGKP